MYHIITGNPKFDRDYFRFLHEYLSSRRSSWLDILKALTSVEVSDSYITDYDIFESVSDFACKNKLFGRIVVKSGGKYSSIEYYDLEFKSDDRLYFYMIQNWTYDLNKYIMSKFDGKWIRIPKNKYTLVR